MEYKNVKIIRVDKCVKVQTFEREVCLLTAEYSFLKRCYWTLEDWRPNCVSAKPRHIAFLSAWMTQFYSIECAVYNQNKSDYHTQTLDTTIQEAH